MAHVNYIINKHSVRRDVFGDLIDIYDMTQSIENGATRPVYYESRGEKLQLAPATLALIDKQYDLNN